MQITIHQQTSRGRAGLGALAAFRFVLLLVAIGLTWVICPAQSPSKIAIQAPVPAKAIVVGPAESAPAKPKPISAEGEQAGEKSLGVARSEEGPAETGGTSTTPPQFRIERMPLLGGAELLTVMGRLDGMRTQGLPAPEVPLVSVVRDTLGDNDQENDRLRYVWMLTYTKPNLLKQIASAIPFLYQHVENQTRATTNPPQPIIDLANISRQTWNRFFWMGMQSVFLDSYGIPLKASSRTYRRNASDYRMGHVTQALSILNNYENLRQRSRDQSELLALSQGAPTASTMLNDGGVIDAQRPLLPERAPTFTAGEMLELRARLILSGKTFGGLFPPGKFHDTVTKRSMESVDTIGHNWEMLRQRAEAEGLYFEPLTMPDGEATHALLWVSRSDLAAQPNRHFNDRFLSIANPWSDGRLRNWKGYSQTRYFDQDSRLANDAHPNSRSLEMIPLALYGLDHPRIPALLVDFRDSLNPKRREMSQRVLHDLTKNIFSLSNFGNIPYFLGHTLYDFVTGRRGIDLNQPTRARSYSELKLLLSFNSSLDPNLRNEIERRLQNVSINPLNNDNQTEIQLARQQYDSLIDYARRPDGLPAKIERERRAEMVPLKHGPAARFFFNLGNVLTFGRYVHREKATPDLSARMETARRMERHTELLKEVAKSPQTEVAWELSRVKRSLQFLAEHGAGANGSAARAAGAIFQHTNDAEMRHLCLDVLYKMNNKTAKRELLRVYREEQPHSVWRVEIAVRLRQAVADNAGIKPAEAKSVLSQVGQP